ncbi:POZ domain-containing KCTD6 [Octopus vulgaris]|uniref:POZ domain-containing KCTD6 n=1 Tax=Octopus vulgaris TaxID=6645 RepID=A0AA36AY44_OCTVU|nr:POZ domain-containing KCTD6 [Octopus vulgaris]
MTGRPIACQDYNLLHYKLSYGLWQNCKLFKRFDRTISQKIECIYSPVPGLVDGFMFRYILNFLRSKKLSLPMDFKEYDLLLTEADFYQIKPLIQDLCKLRDDLADKSGGVFLEIIEVRTGSTATMPTNNSRVKTILSGRKDMIVSLPSHLIGMEALEKLQTKNGLEFAEIELNGSNIRLRLGEYLKNCGWEMVDSQLSSSSGYDAKALMSSLIIEQSYRDRWCLFSRRKSQAFSHTSLN